MFEIVCKKVFIWDWRYLVEGFRRPAALSQSYKRPVGVLLRRILGSSPNQCVNSQPSLPQATILSRRWFSAIPARRFAPASSASHDGP